MGGGQGTVTQIQARSGAGGESDGGRPVTKGLPLGILLCTLFGQES